MSKQLHEPITKNIHNAFLCHFWFHLGLQFPLIWKCLEGLEAKSWTCRPKRQPWSFDAFLAMLRKVLFLSLLRRIGDMTVLKMLCAAKVYLSSQFAETRVGVNVNTHYLIGLDILMWQLVVLMWLMLWTLTFQQILMIVLIALETLLAYVNDEHWSCQRVKTLRRRKWNRDSFLVGLDVFLL